MLYIDADVVRAIIADASQRSATDLVSDSPLLHNPSLAGEINAAWRARAESPSSLVAEDRLERIVRMLGPHEIPRRSNCALNLNAVRQVRDYIQDRIDEPMTTTELARVAGLSRFQLTRQFQRAFGLPLHAYYLQIRLEEARRRLRHGQAVAAVAADLGFADQSHFHRRFRARFGVTPAEWRRTAIQED